MRVLDAEQAASFNASLIGAITRKTLETIVLTDGIREVQIKHEVSRWLPQTIPSEEIGQRVSDALDWFVIRGDIEKGTGGRYRCLPPYLIEVSERGSQAYSMLYGDPCGEASLERVLRQFDGRVQYRKPPIGEMDQPTNARSSRGWERMIIVPAANLSEAMSACVAAGIIVFRSDAIKKALPRISEVTAPPEQELSRTTPSAGFWDAYRPAAERESRWLSTKYWKNSDACLVRWKPTEEWSGYRDRRYFYHAGDGRVAELDTDTASLWQLYLDHEANRPRQVWRDKAYLWVPKVLPLATYQWLRLLSKGPVRSLGRWSVVEIDHRSFEDIRKTLDRTLGLRCADGRPAYNRRSWSR